VILGVRSVIDGSQLISNSDKGQFSNRSFAPEYSSEEEVGEQTASVSLNDN
jgi:hypothetical protein